MRCRLAISVLILAVISGCTIKPPPVIVTSEKTSLEKQLLGTNDLITDDPVALTAVWSRDFAYGFSSSFGDGDSVYIDSGDKRRLILAQIRRQTLKDHIDQFKKNGFLGERANGFLTVIPDSLAQNEEILRIVAAENTDRAVIWEFYAIVSGDDPENALLSIRENFAEIMIKSSPTGTWVEDQEGAWARK
ncbi:MAG: DUF1318 domain-containing protein [candidate division Zixibacteria bacterium]